jgi:hypothetical protein
VTVPDLGALTWEQFFIILVAVALFDFVTGIVGSLRDHTFTVDKLLEVLDTHILRRAIPLGLLFGVGQIANAQSLIAIAVGGLAIYIGETVLSSASNLSTPAAVPAPNG